MMATPESGDDYSVIFDGVNLSTQVVEYLVGSPAYTLITGATYRFKVVSYNFNGAGTHSNIISSPACGEPSGLAKPVKLTSATTPTPSITIQWTAPTSDGGCPITGYAVYVDDGAGGSFVEANSDNDALVRGQPTLRELVVTRVSTVGATYRIQVVAISEVGQVTSTTLGVILASLPLQPPSPTLVASTSSSVTLDISSFPSSSEGGCPIVSFDI